MQQSYAEAMVSDEEYERREQIFPLNTPISKEMFFFRKTFQEFFPTDE